METKPIPNSRRGTNIPDISSDENKKKIGTAFSSAQKSGRLDTISFYVKNTLYSALSESARVLVDVKQCFNLESLKDLTHFDLVKEQLLKYTGIGNHTETASAVITPTDAINASETALTNTTSEALQEGAETALKANEWSISQFFTKETLENVGQKLYENRVSIGIAATWGFVHSKMNHVATNKFPNLNSYVRTGTTFILTGVTLWGISHLAKMAGDFGGYENNYGLEPTDLAHMGLSMMAFKGVLGVTRFVYNQTLGRCLPGSWIKNTLTWSWSFPVTVKQEKRKKDD